jgi:aminopeptidase YwaD
MTENASRLERVSSIVDRLCSVTPDRRPGSAGNDEAVDLVARWFDDAGWDVTLPRFDCLDWVGGDAFVRIGDERIRVVPSPYGSGVDAVGTLRVARTASDLTGSDLTGAVIVVTGELVAEPMTPKRFPFYGSDEHTAIVGALEAARPAAIVAVTGKYPELCGALDPFPWIEDGDFSVPAAAVREVDAEVLVASDGEDARIEIDASRIPSTARNVIARRGLQDRRVTVCAHIDTKPGTPGAVDNATGVATLVLLAEALGHRTDVPVGVELLAVNGEDHFAGPGEVAWLEANEGRLEAIELFVNIDGTGYRRGRTAFSLYNVDEAPAVAIRDLLAASDGLIEGPPWYQSDHAILAMRGRPALAFTTELIDEMLAEVFHASHDTPDRAAPGRVVELAAAIERLIIER